MAPFGAFARHFVENDSWRCYQIRYVVKDLYPIVHACGSFLQLWRAGAIPESTKDI